ncbi:MAG: hypothetical protein PHC97_01320 [Patescibacteria group bacterium]|nr:hypothetical protein [Patescibacteria group bacterium]
MALTNRSRRELFGQFFSDRMEDGDAARILNDLQYDDQKLAIYTFRRVWDKVKQDLINYGGWVTMWEALELAGILLKGYNITNPDIFTSVFEDDQDLYMWGQINTLDQLIKERESSDAESRKEIDRGMVIRAFIDEFMSDSREMQDFSRTDRLEFVFYQELQAVVNLLIERQIKCSADELKNHIHQSMSKLPSYLLTLIDTHFARKLQEITPKEFDLGEKVELEVLSLPDLPTQKVIETVEVKEVVIKQPAEASVTNSAEAKQKLVEIQKPVAESQKIQFTTEGLCEWLEALIPRFKSNEELRAKVKEELAKLKKVYCTGPNKLNTFYHLICDLIKIYGKKYNWRDKQNDANIKIGVIYGALNALQTAMGGDLAVINDHQKAICTAR